MSQDGVSGGLQSLSPVTQAVLVGAGLGAALLCLYFVYGIFSCVRGAVRLISSFLPQSKPKPKSKKNKSKESDSEAEAPVANVVPGKERGPDLKSLIKAEKAAAAAKKKGTTSLVDQASHELFINTLKDHADTVHGIAWSTDGQLLASACEDMQIRIFDLQDLANRNPKFRRVKTAKIPMGVGFGDSPDAVATSMRGVADTIVALYQPISKTAGEAAQYDAAWKVEHAHAREAVLAMQSVPSSQAVGGVGYVVSLTTKKEGKVFSMQGRELAVFEPSSLANHDLAVSIDGRFIAVASFSSDVKLWEMRYSREGEFKGCIKSMGLMGHKGQVMAVAISQDNKRAATASKDGMLKVWDIDVRYHLSEDPKVKLSFPMPLSEGRVYQRLAFGPPRSNLLAACFEGTVHLLSTTTGELVERIDAHDGPITALRWCPVPRKVVVGGEGAAPEAAHVFATASRDRRVRIWRAPV